MFGTDIYFLIREMDGTVEKRVELKILTKL